jgi:hypothetical protein
VKSGKLEEREPVNGEQKSLPAKDQNISRIARSERDAEPQSNQAKRRSRDRHAPKDDDCGG